MACLRDSGLSSRRNEDRRYLADLAAQRLTSLKLFTSAVPEVGVKDTVGTDNGKAAVSTIQSISPGFPPVVAVTITKMAWQAYLKTAPEAGPSVNRQEEEATRLTTVELGREREAAKGSELSSGNARRGDLGAATHHHRTAASSGAPGAVTAKTDQYEPLLLDGQYGIYRIDSGPSAGKLVDIVLLHGLQTDLSKCDQAWLRTWTTMTKEGEVFWPGEWLSQEPGFNRARILSVCYMANLQQVRGQEDFEFDSAATALLRNLISPSVAVGWEGRKVVLVGHSMGGLMVNALVHSAAFLRDSAVEMGSTKTRARAFVDNLRGLVYYATPHSGTSVDALYDLLRASIGKAADKEANEPLLRYFKTFSKATGSSKARFYGALHNRPRILCFAETQPTHLPGFEGGPQVIVQEQSAYLQPCIGLSVATDHINIVKPGSRTQPAYTTLVNYIRETTQLEDQQADGMELL